MPLRIQIETIKGAIGVERRLARIDPGQPDARVYIRSRQARVEVDTRPVVMEIDYRDLNANLGALAPIPLSHHLVASHREAALSGIAQIARTGDTLAAIETGISIADIAAEALDQDGVALGPSGGLPPSYPPMRASGGGVTMEPVPGELRFDAPWRPIGGTYHPGNVRVYMLTQPEVRITVVGSATDVLV